MTQQGVGTGYGIIHGQGFLGQFYTFLKSLPRGLRIAKPVILLVDPTEEEIREDVPEILKIIGLSERAHHFPSQLSGGEKQRVAIGRALAHKPTILIADEPTGNLDPLHTWDIVRLLFKINEMGTTVILATHDREIINTIGKRVVTLDKGRVIRDEENGRYMA